MLARNATVAVCLAVLQLGLGGLPRAAFAAGPAISISVNTYGACFVGTANGDVFAGTVNGPWSSRGNVFGVSPPAGDELAGVAVDNYGLLVAVSRLGHAFAYDRTWISLGNVFGGPSADRAASITIADNHLPSVLTDTGDVYIRIAATTWQKRSSITGAPTPATMGAWGEVKARYR